MNDKNTAQSTGTSEAKAATAAVKARQAAVKAELPFSDRADFADAARGFVATMADVHIVNDKGRTVWNLGPYGFLNEPDSPDTVNPSLWRQAQLNLQNGLFEVVPGVYQIRGLDLANMTLIEGDRGVAVVDCLTSIEGARAGMELYFQHRGRKPVSAVILTHTHADHWGGLRGVLTEEEISGGQVPIIAPDGFMEYAVSENVIAGPAMHRRAQYQFGHFLPPGPCSHVDCGLGKAVALGSLALVAPNDLIIATGDTRTIDGIEYQFQMAPESEAPAELHFYLPKYKVLNLAENCNHTFHNLLPFRGAAVRDALAWSKYLAEALVLWGGKAEVLCGQHHWPVWGAERVAEMIGQQRDLYKFAHDQTVRLMNHGLTPGEIAETLQPPKSLDGAWHIRGYYGHIRHNIKAIYQRYLGWYDANPANLDPLPRVETGRKTIEYMGGAEAVLARAQADFDRGEFRFVAQVLSHLVFAEPGNTGARTLLADTFEQLGYLAESATWRNAYLTGARELRHGLPQLPPGTRVSPDTIRALATEQLWDVLGIRLNGPKAEGLRIVTVWDFSDTGETYTLTLENCALTYVAGRHGTADATVTTARTVLDAVFARQMTIVEAVMAGRLSVAGDVAKLRDLMALMDNFTSSFEIVEPVTATGQSISG